MKSFTIVFFCLLLFSKSSFSQNRDSLIIDLDPNNFVKDFSNYNQSTAIFMGQLSKLAYLETDSIKVIEHILQVTYPTFNISLRLIRDKPSGTESIIFVNNEFLVIAFRGTEFQRIKDVISDIKIKTYENKKNTILGGLPVGHGGFRKGIMNLIVNQNIFGKLDSIITKNNGSPKTFDIYLTGHSLGAALATMFMGPLDFRGYKFSGSYNFAPPLAVAKSASKDYISKFNYKTYDLVNYVDYIPRAGRSNRKKLIHIGKFYRICLSGVINHEKEQYIKYGWWEKQDLIKYHKLNSYLFAIKDDKKNSDALIYQRNLLDIKCSFNLKPNKNKKDLLEPIDSDL